MQALTRTELKWIHDELQKIVTDYDSIVQEYPDTPDAYIAELRRDGLRNVLRKLQIAYSLHDKRIAID